ncbi:gfo/Idh/MocA family oxidoreductase [Shewanella putrefaciens]|uniref:Gfo/Idh/MocA family oxidoreductase n=1 Tax=unclassified Shewanella TaxID=196818 RepID=UPI0020068675|nr:MULTISPECIES: Gfo/Idh/MocA family oxidoreductase [unclassified Shewanella]MCK7630238.1 gfo/Idh/MocA family oxidoreductase [Shewanella sp. JNE9-1]MCK7653398.1 gfo/Idh/MocA family oxidoreductase [Shewanella sp. JNE4-1]
MIWLIGSGLMSIDYARVLDAQGCDYQVIGRGSKSAKLFTEKTGKAVICGGLAQYIANTEAIAEAAIVSVGVAQLYETTKQLIEAGVKKILVEKPGAISLTEIEHLYILSIKYSAEVFIAYNRRFFSSVLEAQNLIKLDGGVTSFNFEFTEWSHVIEKIDKSPSILERWFLANSTHVADLAFYLGGKPREISCYVDGALSWHQAGSIFSGAGMTEQGALFNYAANWESAGRWSVEVLTKENRYVFRPMEALQVQRRGAIPLVTVEVDDSLDKEFKPGLFKQVSAFLSGKNTLLCSLEEQRLLFPIYQRMAGY